MKGAEALRAAVHCAQAALQRARPSRRKNDGTALTAFFAYLFLQQRLMSDNSSDARALAGESRALAARAARTRADDLVRERRATLRGGAAPMPRTERRVSKAAQYERDVSAESILEALEHRCGCKLEHCVMPTSDLVRACRLRKLRMTAMGTELTVMLRSAVLKRDDKLVLDMKSSQVSIAVGVVACPNRFFSLFSIKSNMRSQMKKAVAS